MKTEQLQIRVSKKQKAALRRLARIANLSLSEFVLSKVLEPPESRFLALVSQLKESNGKREVFAEMNDLLSSLQATEFQEFLIEPSEDLSPFMKNYLAAMIERRAREIHCLAPEWVRRVKPLENPYFGSEIESLRGYLLVSSPVEFKKRNIFIDSTLGSRI